MGRDRLGFELAREFDLRQIGLLYYVADSSDTLVEALLHESLKLLTKPRLV